MVKTEAAGVVPAWTTSAVTVRAIDVVTASAFVEVTSWVTGVVTV